MPEREATPTVDIRHYRGITRFGRVAAAIPLTHNTLILGPNGAGNRLARRSTLGDYLLLDCPEAGLSYASMYPLAKSIINSVWRFRVIVTHSLEFIDVLLEAGRQAYCPQSDFSAVYLCRHAAGDYGMHRLDGAMLHDMRWRCGWDPR